MDERPATDFSAGAIKVTGRNLDIATNSDGFIGIQSPTGDEAYVRTASMQVLENGNLVDVKGNSVLNESGTPINIPPTKSITIGDDGTISIVPADSQSLRGTGSLRRGPDRQRGFCRCQPVAGAGPGRDRQRHQPW